MRPVSETSTSRRSQCLVHEALAWEEEKVLLFYDLAPSDRRCVGSRLGINLPPVC